ncbi:hypothetical protein CKQ79_29720, partial [Klebsiella pneumoniae]
MRIFFPYVRSPIAGALGYSSWEKGQLEQEILDNAWLTAPADQNILSV